MSTQQPHTHQSNTPKRWREVLALKGTLGRQSDMFQLNSEPARLHYQISGPEIAMSVYLVKAGESLWEVGGIPFLTLNNPGSGTVDLPRVRGTYYLELVVANARWSISVETAVSTHL